MHNPSQYDVEFVNFKKRCSLRQIEVICTLMREGSMLKAANILGVSEAAISRICKRFESHFSFDIFAKTRKGVVFTSESEPILERLVELDDLIANLATCFQRPKS